MKIIATTTANGFLIEANGDEIARLMGEPYASYYNETANKAGRPTIRVGTTIHIDKAWKKLKAIEDIPRTLRSLDELATSIQTAVATHKPIVEHELDPPKEGT